MWSYNTVYSVYSIIESYGIYSSIHFETQNILFLHGDSFLSQFSLCLSVNCVRCSFSGIKSSFQYSIKVYDVILVLVLFFLCIIITQSRVSIIIYNPYRYFNTFTKTQSIISCEIKYY